MGHIFFIAPSSPGSLDRLSQWTFRWLLEHGDLAEDSTMYTCNSIEDATNLLESALIIGQSPALIILDHADRPHEQNLKFSKLLHDGCGTGARQYAAPPVRRKLLLGPQTRE